MISTTAEKITKKTFTPLSDLTLEKAVEELDETLSEMAEICRKNGDDAKAARVTIWRLAVTDLRHRAV